MARKRVKNGYIRFGEWIYSTDAYDAYKCKDSDDDIDDTVSPLTLKEAKEILDIDEEG